MKQTVYLIRHGHTTGTDQRLMYGATDVPLSEGGRRDVAEMAAAGVYPDPEGAVIYTSGMLRAEQTMEIIYGKAEHRTEPLLKEINMGIFEMKTAGEIRQDPYGRAWLDGEIEDPEFEGGERFSGFIARANEGMRKVLDECASEGTGRIIVVIHGAVITVILDALFPGVQDNMWSWTPNPGSGFAVEFEDGKAVSVSPIGTPEGWSEDRKEFQPASH